MKQQVRIVTKNGNVVTVNLKRATTKLKNQEKIMNALPNDEKVVSLFASYSLITGIMLRVPGTGIVSVAYGRKQRRQN